MNRVLFSALIFSLAITVLWGSAWASTPRQVVVSSSQDYDIAKLVSDSLESTLVVTEWGRFTEDDAERVLELNAEKLIIIGGIYAVPKGVEELGVSFERVGGGDRIETARLALERFFEVRARSYALPSKSEIRRFISESGERKAYIVLGDSAVSQRWGKYYSSKLDHYIQVEELRAGEKLPEDLRVLIAVGNVGNNKLISEHWSTTNLPPELTYFPIVYLKRSEEFDILFICGSDQNLFFTQRVFEDMNLQRIAPRGALVFLILVLFQFIWLARSEKDPRYLGALALVAVVFLLLHLRSLEKAKLAWDSLYVYFDGALSLSFLGQYETILTGRSAPGTSYLTFIYFLLTSPSDGNAHLLTLLLALWILLVSYSLSTKILGKQAGLAAALLLATNPFFHDRISYFASEVPFAAFTLTTLWVLSGERHGTPILGGLLLAFSAFIRPSALLLYPAALIYLSYRRELKELLLFSASSIFFLLTFEALASLSSVISAYSIEIAVKTGYSPLSPDVIVHNARQALLFSFLLINPLLTPGLFLRRYETRFEGISLAYTLLHLASLSLWIGVSSRYLFPLLPVLTIIQTTGIVGTKEKRIWVFIPAALALNIYMLLTGYRYPILS